MSRLIGLVATAVFLSTSPADGGNRSFAKIPEVRDFEQDAGALFF